MELTIIASCTLDPKIHGEKNDFYQKTSIKISICRTPFHSDVFGSFSWSSNIYGRKRWFILPPGQEQKLKDSLGNLPFSISIELLQSKNVKYFDVIQESNETIFVPSKWHHQVTNIDDAVSINHNWFNGCNVNFIADSLLCHNDEVEREIADCRDMENFDEHCQLMLKSSFGMNFAGFLEILTHIADKRINAQCKNIKFKVFDNFSFGDNHMTYDLKAVLQLLTRLKDNKSFRKFDELVNLMDEYIDKIKKVV